MENVEIPKVLLLGSGLDQAYGGLSWEDFLESVAIDKYKENICKLTSPEPLKAVLITGDNVDKALSRNKKILTKTDIDDEYIGIIRSILDMKFDDILTTNYTYELESVALLPRVVNDKNIRDLKPYPKRKERYYIHTYNEVTLFESGYKNRVWHVHGEASCPGGMILGHYYYGTLLGKIQDYLRNRKGDYFQAQTKGKNISYDSWIDSFIMGDVYVLGFGFGLSELDFWWLINRKAREKAKTGKVYFYEPSSCIDREKIQLLETLKHNNGEKLVEHIDLGYKKIKSRAENEGEWKYVLDGEWKEFYMCALNDIQKRIKGENLSKININNIKVSYWGNKNGSIKM